MGLLRIQQEPFWNPALSESPTTTVVVKFGAPVAPPPPEALLPLLLPQSMMVKASRKVKTVKARKRRFCATV